MHNPVPMRPGKSPPRLRHGFGALALRGLGALALIAVVVAGCGDAKETRPAKWSFIYPAIIEPQCATASCHSRFGDRAGVDLSNIDEAYFQLVKRFFVVPGNVAESTVVKLMRAQGARRMPPDFALPEVDIDLIETWIMAGAPNN